MDVVKKFEDDEKNALEGLAEAPPPRRKAHSYSHQLRTNTGTHHKRHHQMRKHSLDVDYMPNSIDDSGLYEDSSEDEGFYPYSTCSSDVNNSGSVGGNGGGVVASAASAAAVGGSGRQEFNMMSQNFAGLGVIPDCLDDDDDQQLPLPEFAASGGGVGMFKVPVRAAVHPSRPSCHELRPHPLRETQVGRFLRTIACTDTQLWAGQECGVRVWNFSDQYEAGLGFNGRAKRGDEDAAPFYESVHTPPAICLVVDSGSKLVWSGHKDGKIRSWRMDQPNSDDAPFKEGLSWQAHRGPVLSMVISSYGDIWSGSEGGIIKVWPWESVEKSLSLSPEEKHMAALLVERAAIDLRSLVTVNGVCNISSSEVKCLLSDHVRAKVWAAGSLSFSLWDARNKELLKVYNVEGQIENRVDISSVQDQSTDDDLNVKFVSKAKKEKSQGSSFLQRSRNAILGAADAVRRVATKGAFVEDSKKTEVLVLAADGMIWSGCSSGLLVQWDGNGNRLQDFHHHRCAVLCLCAHGSRIWVGYVSGMVQALDLDGNLLAGWLAHNGPVIRMAVGNDYVFSLANHGGIRGWSLTSPGPIDNILRPQLSEKESSYTSQKNLRVLIGTWNVGQGRASPEALATWLGSTASDVGIIVVGLQEVEMGAGFLAMSAAKETVGLEGSSVGQWWQDAIGKALNEGTTFERVGSRQLAALLIAIWVRKSIRNHVGDLDVGAVACGIGRAIGNKGGVGLRLRVFDRIMCFTNCHFAAHLEAVNRRNADFTHIFRTMVFTKSSSLLTNSAAGVSSSAQMLRGANTAQINPDEGRPELSEADLVIFTGDFNYRLFGISYDEARDFVSQRCFDWLREKDQLRAEMNAGKVFQGMREAIIRFPPTYKFERGKPGLGGDIWSGSEGGIIKVWPWESVEKSLSLSPEEKHMAALLVERAAIDLRSLVTVNGVCNISSSEVKCLLSDHVRAKVWAAGSLSFSLWDARNKELLKVYNVEGQIENRVDISSVQDQSTDDDLNVKFVSKAKKEKSQGSSFLQRSRNAILGAADAVRRVATKGAFVEDSKKTEVLVLAADGMIWSGCSSGLLVQWDGNGNRLQDFHHHRCAVLCLCAHGSRIWVGYVSGMVQALDLDGNLLAGWLAHNGPVIRMAVGNDYVFSLANHGGIRGWSLTSPGPIDNILRPQLSEKESSYTSQKNLRVLIGTWNVGQGRASPEALATWLGSTASDVGIIVVGLQEVEMGAGFLAMSAAKETVGLEGSSVGQWWQDAIGKALNEGTTFERVGSRQLAALLIAIWVRKSIRNHVGDLDVGAVACGIGRAIGNKGGVGLRLRVFDRIMCFTNCHFAAHLEAVNRRNADFTHIFRTMVFTKSSSLLTNSAAGVSSSAQMLRGANTAQINPDEGRPELSEADLVIFTGDFNYRLFGISYDEARDFVSQRCFDWLREKDQLRAEMNAGKVFQGMREAIIRFPPTYKFERGKPGLGGYDSGEKKRIPAWCDRVLYRDNRATPSVGCSLQCPVVASIIQYEACMEVTESDHKPVRCKFHVEIAHVDRSVRRQQFGDIFQNNEKIKSLLEEFRFIPETLVSASQIVLQNQDTYNLRISSKSKEDKLFFQITCGGQSTIKEDEQASEYHPRASFGFPRWLEVTPAAGIIKPDQAAEILIRHEEFNKLEETVDGIPQSWWCEDTRDKEVILLINVTASRSTEARTHKVHVRHSFSANAVRTTSKSSSRRSQGGGSSHHRSALRHVGSGSEDHQSLRGP